MLPNKPARAVAPFDIAYPLAAVVVGSMVIHLVKLPAILCHYGYFSVTARLRELLVHLVRAESFAPLVWQFLPLPARVIVAYVPLG